MDLYRATFAGSLLLNALAFYQSHRSRKAAVVETATTDKKDEHEHLEPDLEGLSKLKKRFFPIYLLVNAADWLQGPYIYPIYKDEKGLPEETVAFLFLIGFISAGISASFVGTLADRYGRKTACLGYCALYSLSCTTLLSDNIYVLFFGRILGGVCGTVLWSVFESWMVAEFNQLMLPDGEPHLSAIFSTMTTSNTCVAIGAGIFAEWAVRMTGTAKTPFMASIGCLSLSFLAISKYWGENYGTSSRRASETEGLLQQEEATPAPPATSALRTILRDRNIMMLALVSGFFEGSLFLFIFFKFPALKLSHKLAGSTDELPFGLIFAILMCSMMFGSLLYKHLSTSATPVSAQKMLTGILAVSSACFFVPGHFRDERLTLWCFCIFELCCGVYYPAMGSLKSKLVEDGSRASIYGILRIPLNVFVVLALSTTKEARIFAGVFVVVFLIVIFHNEESAGTALLPYLPVLPSTGSSQSSSILQAWIKDRSTLSEKSWKKSVELRDQMAKQHPDNPKIPFFPMDFLKYPFTIWDFFPATWTCPHDIQRVGRLGDGGKWVCGMNIYESLPAPKSASATIGSQEPLSNAQEGLVMYSFGINGESSFEAEMLERIPSARIWGYDFSVDAWGPQIAEKHRHRTFFKKVGLGKEDKHDSEPPFWTLPSLMKQNNHTYIDILKIDIEGSEYDALDTMMNAFDNMKTASGKSVLPIGQVMIELHLGDGINTENANAGGNVDFGRFRTWWERLERMGMRPVWMEINLFAVTLGKSKANPRCTEYVWVNAKDQRSVLWNV
ncbi:unnamed protein product [Alternaria alternata]